MMQIKKAEFVISSPNIGLCPLADKPEFAFIGRSNVGKSSLINMICNHQGLAKTSGTPGKTQLINHFLVNSAIGSQTKANKWYLVDLPGYGYAKVSVGMRQGFEKMIKDYLLDRKTLLQLFVLIDSRHEPQKNDIVFCEKMYKWQMPITLVFTKADKEKQKVVHQNVQLFINELKKTWQYLPQYVVTSAEKKMGKEKILEIIETNIQNEKEDQKL
jgi:GTP-binding protein